MNLPMREIEKAAANEKPSAWIGPLSAVTSSTALASLPTAATPWKIPVTNGLRLVERPMKARITGASAEASAPVPLTARLKKSRRPCRRCS